MARPGDMVKRTNAWACYDCGKCTATCPIARVGGDYSPRRHVLAANHGRDGEVDGAGTLGSCLTCGLCDLRCPVQVDYTNLVRELRELVYRPGAEMECPHGGALQSTMRMMANGGVRQNRLGWVTDDLKTDREKGHVFYWAGCAVYYDAFFPKQGPKLVEGNEAAVRLLNYLHFTPVVSPEERCCGHDLLWNGDRENFERLARHNVALIAASGADILVTSCAECLRTWKIDYAAFFGGKPPQIFHITEFLAQHMSELKFEANGERKITYQDPCRLGRHLGVYDPPRDLLRAVPGVELVEMRNSRHAAVCCAGGTWSNCDRFAKRIQVDRLREARATDADVLATACPKCQIHFSCAMKDPNLGGEIEIEMRDVAQLVLDSLSIGRTAEQTSRGSRSPAAGGQ
jgi:heterodisulfide reductase subunit D